MEGGRQIRRFRSSDEAGALDLLLSKMLPEARAHALGARRARWRWQYYDNPGNPEAEPILWVADGAATLAGLVCPLAVRLRTPKGPVGASWCNDWIVDAAQRGTGLGWALEDAWVKTFPVALGRGWSERAYLVSVKLGLVTVPGFWRAWIVLSRLKLAALLASGKQYRRLSQLTRLAPKLALRGKPPVPEPAEVLADLPRDAGDLWARVGSCYAFGVERSYQYLRWRYLGHPTQKFHFIRAGSPGQPRGLAVVRLSADRPPVGVICDLIADPGDPAVIAGLLTGAVNLLGSMGACAVVVEFPPKLAPSLFAFPKPMLREEMKILVGDNRKAYEDMGIYDAASWYISRSDSDIDFGDCVLS